jgi:hypothetical protein
MNMEREEQFDDEKYEDIWEAIRDEGRLVGRREWDGGGPGAGAGTVDVYLYRGAFYGEDDVDGLGPYATFAEAAEAISLFVRTDATRRIWLDPEFRRDLPDSSATQEGR